MWRTTNASGTHDVVDDNLGCGRRHLSVNVSNLIKRVLIYGRWISHGQLCTSEPWENQRKLETCVTDYISPKYSMGLHWAWRFKMLNRVSANQFITLIKIFYYGRTVWGHSKMEKHFSWWRHQMVAFSALPAFCERNPLVHRAPVDSPHKGQWRGVLMFSLICGWTNGWANNQNVDDLKRHRAHYCVAVM